MHSSAIHSVISNVCSDHINLSTVLYLRELHSPTYVNQVIAWLRVMANDVKSCEAIVQ